MASQLKTWLNYKYRTRRICYKNTNTEKTITEYRTPVKDPNTLIFSVNQSRKKPNPENIYFDLSHKFGKTLDRMGKGAFEDDYKRRRKITFHSFRRNVKGIISDLGYGDFSEYFIGHSGSTYYRKTQKEKEELFNKIEPSLTFLDLPSLERKGADFQSKIDTLERENLSLRQRDSMNSEAIANLSDQLMSISTRLQEIEKFRH